MTEGVFDQSTADREDNSGILGLGYENGSATDSLHGYWRLDKTAGGARDYSGEQNGGEVYGADRNSKGILGTSGSRFEGSADEVVIPDDSSLDFSNGFTINTWINPNQALNVKPSMSSNPEIFSKGNSYSLTIQNQNYIAFSQNSNLQLMNSTGHITNLGVDTSVIGPLSDYDQDGVIDIPYVDGSGNLDIINKNGNNQNLATGAKVSSSTLGAGDLDNDGRKEIYYIDSSTSNIRKYNFSSNTDSLVGGGIAGTAISGVADYDGDGNKDLVFLDSSQTISWYNGSSVQSTGKSIAGTNSYQYWIGGTTGPGVGKYESSWTDLSGNANSPTNSIYSGTYTGKAYYLGGGSGEVTKWNGAFTDISPSTSNTINAMSSRSSEVLAGAGSDIYLYNTSGGIWSQPASTGATIGSASNSYSSSNTGDYWLLGHGKANQPGGVKYYITKFDGSSTTALDPNIFSNPVEAIKFNGTHYMAGSSGGSLAIYDGSSWTQPNSNVITSNGNSIYSIGWGTIDGDSFWLVGDGSGNIVKIQEDGTTTDLGNPTGNAIRSIGYSGDSEKFFIGDGSGNVIRYNSSGLAQTGNSIFSNSLRTLQYNPTSSRKKMGAPSDLDKDGAVEVPIVTDGSNLALVSNSGSTNVIDSGYGNAKASPLGTVDWNGNPAEEIIHINTNSDTLYLSDISGNEQAVTRSDSTQVTGVEQSPGISAGSMPEGTPVLQINGQNALNKGGQPLNPGSWTMVTAKYNASTGLAELYFNSTLIESKTTGLGTVNPNSQDFKIANGKLNATIDEVRAYNQSLGSSKINRLFFNGTDGQFDGAYNSTIINPEGKKSWNKFMLDVNESADTSVSATVYSLDGSNNVLNTDTINVNDGTQNYSISGLQNSKKIKFSFDGYSNDIKDTWEIFQTQIYYEDSFKVGNVSHDDYSDQHKFNISATARGADSDDQISGCTAYYSTEAFTSYYSVDGTSFSESFGDSKTASCNSTITTDLTSVGYGNSDFQQVSFKFNFTDNDGYTVETANQTETLPNNQPDILDTNREVSSTGHEFSFSAVANDRDGEGDITGCSVYAEDSDGNTQTLGSSDASYGNSTQVSCNSTVSSSLSGFEVGEDIQIYAEFTDVADAFASTAIYTETIPNHNPVIDSGPTLEKVSGEHAFNVSAVASDTDAGSSEINSCKVYAEDGDGNTEVFSGSGLVNQSYGATDQASCNTSISNSISGFTVGETITVDVKFSDRHGAETGNVTGTKEIPNTAPGKPTDLNMTYFLSQGADLQHVLDHTPKINWTNPTDPEGDQITVKAYTESSPNPNQLDAETNSTNELSLGQNIGLSDGTTYNVSLRACDPYSCSSYTQNIEFTMNEQPSIQSVSLNSSSVTGSDSVKLQANITDTQDKIDWANYTVYNQSSGTQIYSNKQGTLSSELWNSDAFEVLAGNTYNWTLKTSDGYQTSSTTGTFSVSNSPPEITEPLSTTEYSNAHKFNASAVAYEPDGEINIDKFNITLNDGDGNQKTFTENLTKAYGNSSEVAANFSNVNSSIMSGFKVNEEISVSIKFIDNGGKTASTSGNQRIPNKVPDIPQDLNMTYFLQENTDIDHVLDHTPKINWSNPNDPEGDSVTIKAYTGTSSTPTTLDDSINLGTSYGDSSSLNLGNSVSLSDGNTYNTTLIACDEYGCSSRSENIEFHMNEEPSIDNSALNDSSPTGSDLVKVLSNVTDNEDQISDVKFTVWNTDSNTKILSSNSGTDIDGEWASNEFEVFASTSYNFTVNATDGYEHTLDTGTFSVPNTAPSMVSGPSFQDYNAGHKFNVSAVAEDVDGQENLANYTIQLDDGETVYEYTKDVNRNFGGSNEVAANFSNVNNSIEGFEVEETIFVTVIFRDKSGETTQNFESHTIPNHQPDTATNVNMSQLLEPGTDLQHVTDQTPEINFTAPSDSDKDNITFSIFTETSDNPSQLDREILITESNYSTNQEVGIGNQVNLNDGTSYNFSVQACDQYGSCTSKSVIQEFRMNQEPVFNSVELNKSSSNLADGDKVHLIANISDAESDSIDWANFTVYNQTDNDRLINSLNGSINQNDNWISDTWTVSTGTTYNWTVNSTDGYETSETSGTFKTNNSNPEIVSGPSFDNIIGDHAFNVSAVVKDADGETDLSDYTLVLEDGDGNQKTVEKSITNTGYGNSNEASINFSEVNTSIQGFKVNDDIQATITVRDSSGASTQTPTRSNTIPNEVPGTPSDLNMTYFLQENTDIDHVLDQTPEINWTNPTDPEGDQITVKAYTGTSSTPTTLDDSISGSNKLSLGQNAEILDGETYNVRLQACDPYGCSSYTSTIEFTMNQEPFIESVNANSSQITGSDQIKLEANITDSQDTINWANFTVYNQTSGELLFENKNGTLSSELWKSDSWKTRADTTYNYTLNVSDGYQTTDTTGTITVNNQQPEITDLSTVNYNNGHKFNISATATDADGAINIEKFNITVSDGDGNQEEIKASVNREFGTENQAALNYSNINSSYFQGFEVEETLSIDVEVIDRSGSSSSSSTENAIPNHIPDLPQNLDLEVENKNYVVNHSFKINWTNPADNDDDNLTVRAYLGTDQDPLTVENSTSIKTQAYGEADELTVGGNNVNLQDNQDYVIDLVACDNWSCTSRDTNASFHMNQEPRVESVDLNESVTEEAEWIKLIANVTATDNPLDAAFYEVWNQSSPQKLVDEKIESTSGETWNSSIFYGKSLQTYNWTFTASDSYENTTVLDAFDVGNADPEITTGIGTTDLKNEHGFNISMRVRDLNGDTDLANYTVIADDGEQTHRYTETFNSDGDEYAWANYSNINSSISEFEVGETISVQIIARDQHGLKAYSSTVSNTIPNRQPVITGINLKPDNPTTEDTLNITYTAKDPENDEITNSFYEWSGNSTQVSSRTVSPSETSKDQHWNLSLQIVDEYNALSQETTSQETLVIQNSPPEIARAQEVENVSGEHAYTVSAVVSDADGETDLNTNCEVTIEHETNSKIVDKAIDTSYSGSEKAICSVTINASDETWIKPGEKLNTTFTFTDQDLATVNTSKKTALVPNRKPSVTELTSPSNNSETNSTEIKFNWKAQDPEGDNLEYRLEVYNETEKIITESGLTQSEKTISNLENSNIEWQVTAKDLYNGETLSTNTSGRNELLVDSKAPQIVKGPSIEVINSSRVYPRQNQSVKCYSQWQDNFNLGSAKVYENATETNHSVSSAEFSSGWANVTIDANELEAGQTSCTFYASDHLRNNASTSNIFEVEDIEKPNITDFDYSPTTPGRLDPGNPVEVNAKITDNLKLENVSLLYRKESEESWKSGNMTSSGDLYTGNFTPQTDGATYDFKLKAVDTYNNTEFRKASVNVSWDYTWNGSPSDYSGSSTLQNNLVDYTPIKIENTGDFPLKYNITTVTESNLNLDIGDREFIIPSSESKSISVEASLEDNGADDEGIYSFEIKVNSENETANPSEGAIEGQATFTLDAPFLSMEKASGFPLSVSQGTKDVELPVDTTNIGTQSAEEASISYEIPSSWELSSGNLNQELGNMSVDETETSIVAVNIPEDASTGTKQINMTAATTNRTFSQSFQIDITENETTTIVEDGGGGGTGGGPSGPSSQEQVEQRSDQIFNTSESFEIVRGQDQNFTVRFQNPTRFNLTNITANVEGLQSQYLQLANPYLGRVNINESKNITVRITAPEYFQTGNYNLNFNITGKGIDGQGAFADHFGFTLNKEISLGVRAIPRQNASEYLNETRELLDQMNRNNLTTRDLEELISEAENNLESGNYAEVQESFQEARETYQTAQQTREGIQELESQINSAEASGLDVGRARQVASLAEAAMERGAYTTAAERLEEAQNIYQIETAGEINWIYEIRSNWKKILAGLFILVTSGFLARLRYRLYKIRKRLKELKSKEQSIEDLKFQKQKKAFEEKSISLSDYEESMEDYNDQIIDIIEERVELQAEEANISNFKRRDSLAQERDQLNELVRETQQDYVEGNISDTDVYEDKVEELTSRLSEIEGEIAEIDAEAQVRSQSRIGRIMERIPIISSGGVTE